MDEETFESGKKKLQIQKYSDMCGQGLSLTMNLARLQSTPFVILKHPTSKLCSLYSQHNLVGVCRPLPKTLTLFTTKICDFTLLYPIYDLIKKFDILFLTVEAGTVTLNMVCEGLLLMILSMMMKLLTSY